MSDLQAVISTIKKKIVSPKIFAIELDCEVIAFLHLCTAYSLEEALHKTREEIKKDARKNQPGLPTWQLRKYAIAEIADLVNENSTLQFIPSANESLDKNQLMQKIVNEKNTELFHENLSLFSENEKKLLNEKLTLDKKNTKK